MKHMKIVMFLSVCALAACNGRNVGADNNTNENNETETYLTLGRHYVETVRDNMGYDVDSDEPCTPIFEGIELDSPLCRAVNLLYRLGIIVDGNEMFPEYELDRMGAWINSVDFLGFAYYPDTCGATDIEPTVWYVSVVGTLCVKGLVYMQQPNIIGEYDEVPLAEWNDFKDDINRYMNEPPYRGNVFEMVNRVFLQEDPDWPTPVWDCVSPYEDIEPDSFMCFVSRPLVERGVLDPSQRMLHAGYPVTWGELAAILTRLGNIPLTGCTGCSGTPCDWYNASEMDTLCEMGVLPVNVSAQEAPRSIRVVYKVAWDVKLHING